MTVQQLLLGEHIELSEQRSSGGGGGRLSVPLRHTPGERDRLIWALLSTTNVVVHSPGGLQPPPLPLPVPP